MKKVLILTYYWPPSGGAGVQRWLKFTKYLKTYGWEPIIYTAENGEIPVVDMSLLKDIPEELTILKTPIWEPYQLYKRFIGRKKDDKINASFLSENKKAGLSEKISIWIRGNFFIPDARKFWIKPSINYLKNYIIKNNIEFIISSGPPHSMHLIALGLKNKFTSKPSIVTGRGYESVKHSLRQLLDEFDLKNSIFLEDEPRELAKPNPKSLIRSINGMNSKCCIYVGDSMADFIMAKKATEQGCKVIFCGIIGTSKNPQEKLQLFENNGAMLVLESIHLLPKVLNLE